MACPICERKLIFVTGKGGVGKTTVTASLGAMLAARGKRALLVELGEVPSLGRVFDQEHYGYLPQEVRPSLWISRVTPEESLREYGMMKLKLKTVYNLVFGNPFVKALINLVPGMEELLLIGKIEFMVNGRSTAPDGLPFDVVVVDAPPTGQGAGLLSMPMTILLAVKAGPIARDVQRIQDLLTRDSESGVMLVTIPEEMGVDEVLELEEELLRRDIPVCATVVNKAVPELLEQKDEESVAACLHSEMTKNGAHKGVLQAMNIGLALLSGRKSQRQQVDRLAKQSRVPILELPLMPSKRLQERHIQRFAELLSERLTEIDCGTPRPHRNRMG